jgi:hypothetical protein
MPRIAGRYAAGAWNLWAPKHKARPTSFARPVRSSGAQAAISETVASPYYEAIPHKDTLHGLGATNVASLSEANTFLSSIGAPKPPPPSAGKAAETDWLRTVERLGPMALAAAQLIIALRAKAGPAYVPQEKSWAEKNMGLLILGGAGLIAAVLLLKR